MRGYYEKLYAVKLKNLDEMDRISQNLVKRKENT